MRLGGWEILAVLAIVLLLFGPGRIANLAGEIGKSIKSFRDGLSGEDNEDDEESKDQDQ